jgi:hypothetical protein
MDVAVRDHENRDSSQGEVEPYPTRVMICNLKTPIEYGADDGPTQIFLQRALEFLETAPEPDWDGVYVMKSE